jgi:3-oxoacyl-[acyl-carrier protein] reductase
MPDFRGRVALVTGGSIGIGRAIALALAEAGADVAITYRTHAGDQVAKELESHGRRALALAVDVTDPEAVDQFVDEVAAQLGPLDIVVANAGGLIGRVPVGTMPDTHWHTVLDTNLSSAFYLVRASLRHMDKPDGRIILISSMAAFTGGGSGASAYAAAKAGVSGYTLALAKELAPRGITVNAIAPGTILGTPFHETFTSLEAQKSTIARIPLGRPGSPSDVATAVLYLASAEASFVTGEVLKVTGAQELT